MELTTSYALWEMHPSLGKQHKNLKYEGGIITFLEFDVRTLDTSLQEVLLNIE